MRLVVYLYSSLAYIMMSDDSPPGKLKLLHSGKIWRKLNLANWLSVGIGKI